MKTEFVLDPPVEIHQAYKNKELNFPPLFDYVIATVDVDENDTESLDWFRTLVADYIVSEYPIPSSSV